MEVEGSQREDGCGETSINRSVWDAGRMDEAEEQGTRFTFLAFSLSLHSDFLHDSVSAPDDMDS